MTDPPSSDVALGLDGPYRVQVVYPWNDRDGRKRLRGDQPRPRRPWSRTYQVEWPECTWAARGYTSAGALRRARRWARRGGRPPWQVAIHRWVRTHITRRADQ